LVVVTEGASPASSRRVTVSKQKKPPLSDADQQLWQKVTESVQPLDGRPSGAPIAPRRMIKRKEDEDRPLPAEWHMGDAPQPTASIDKKTRRQLSSGRKDVDRSVDLHGMTQDEAYRKLTSVVHGSVKRGDKVLLVVTGKGGKRFSQLAPNTPAAYRTRDEFGQSGGVLKSQVPVWLEGAELKPFIESYGSAAQEHGGEGALYVLLRKRIPGSRRS